MNQSMQTQSNQAEKFNGVIYNEYWNNLNDEVANGDKPETKVSFDTLSPATMASSTTANIVNGTAAKLEATHIRRHSSAYVRPSVSSSKRGTSSVIKLTHVFLVVCFWMTVVFYYL